MPFYYTKDIFANSHKIFTLDKSAKKAIRLEFKDKKAVGDLIGNESFARACGKDE